MAKKNLIELLRRAGIREQDATAVRVSPLRVEARPVALTPRTEADYYDQFLASGVIPDNEINVHMAGRSTYYQLEKVFALDGRGLPRPQMLKRLGTLPCGCAVDGQVVRYGGFCEYCQEDRCSVHWVSECAVCLAPACFTCAMLFQGKKVHKWHMGLLHPIRTWLHVKEKLEAR